MRDHIRLRGVAENDLPIFFDHQLDLEANRMAAFTAKEPADLERFYAHWRRIMADQTVMIRTIVRGASVLGFVLSYEESGRMEVSYWIGKAYWGQGVATRALQIFLAQVNRRRPIFARVAKDNVGSLRVLERCRFRIVGEEQGFANARGKEIEELVLVLAAEAADAPS